MGVRKIDFAWNRAPAQTSGGEWLVVGIIAIAALLLGLFARFKGLGTWSLAPDEYYIARSVDNILRTGLPEYPCGGYYTRGIIYQYVLAGLRLLGLSAEFSGRLVTVLSSLIALPAVYLLGKRVQGRTVGLLAMAILAVSVWEIEMARFARMYAPFQAVFLWYAVYFIRYAADRDSRALVPMLLLSVLGVLSWEGGVVVAFLNLLPPFFHYADDHRITRRQWLYLAACAIVAVLVVEFLWIDWRRIGDPLPPDVLWDRTEEGQYIEAPWETLGEYRRWLWLGLLPLASVAWAAVWSFRFRRSWPTMVGLACALLAALVHQFALVLSILAVLILLRLLDWRELTARSGLPFLIALGTCAAFWTAFMFLTTSWRNQLPLHGIRVVKSIIHRFIEFPDFVRQIVGPWSQAVPLLSLGLLILLSIAAVALLRERPTRPSPERVLLTMLLCMAVVASMGVTPRPETRYLFPVFPIAIVISVAALFRLVAAISPLRTAMTTAVAACVLFAASDDFNLEHLLRIDSPKFNFRLGMSRAQQSHYYPRADLHSLTAMIEKLRRPDDVFITNVVGLDFYYPAVDVTYIDEANTAKLYDWSCRQGTLDRWGNHPLIYRLDVLGERIRAAPRVLLAIDARRYEALEKRMAQWSPQILWQTMDKGILLMTFAAGGGRAAAGHEGGTSQADEGIAAERDSDLL